MLFGGDSDVPGYDSTESSYGIIGGKHRRGHKTRRGKSRRAKTRRGGGEDEMNQMGGTYEKKHGGKRRKGRKSARRKSSRRR